MARGEHLRKYQFQPGESGNPAGSKPLEVNERMLRRYTREHVSEIINRVIELDLAEITALLNDQSVPAFEGIIAKCVAAARSTGDFDKIEKILDRCIGKVPQKIEGEFTTPGGGAIPPATWIIQAVPVPDKKLAADPVAVGTNGSAGGNKPGESSGHT